MRSLFYVQLSFFAVALFLTYLNIVERFFTNKTSSKIDFLKLNEIDFPVHISIVPKLGFFQSKLEEYGYETAYHYFVGHPQNSTGFSWTGNTSQSAQGTFSNLLKFSTVDQIIKHFFTVLCNETDCVKKKLNVSSVFSTSFYPSIRFTLNFKLGKGERLVAMSIGAHPKISFSIVVEDKERFAYRLLRENIADVRGEMVFDAGESVIKEYSMSFTQIHLTPEDTTFNCFNYNLVNSYAKCDQDFMKRVLPSGLVPFWSVPLENISQATDSWPFEAKSLDNVTIYYGKLWQDIDRLMIGAMSSDCRIPCKKTSTTILKGPILKAATSNVAYISLVDNVKIKKITVDKFRFMDSLNFLGSNLGLWPGLGLYQLLEGGIGVIVVYKILEKAKRLLKLQNT